MSSGGWEDRGFSPTEKDPIALSVRRVVDLRMAVTNAKDEEFLD
jgi:hypothetical protein